MVNTKEHSHIFFPTFTSTSATSALAADTIEDVEVKVGKNMCECSFVFTIKGKGVDVRKSKVACDKKCSGVARGVEIEAQSGNVFTCDFSVKKGRGRIMKASVEMGGSTGGSGSGGLGGAGGSGSGGAGGSGSGGSGGSTGGSGGAGGNGSGGAGGSTGAGGSSDCPNGFVNVCPEMGGQCPAESQQICPFEAMPSMEGMMGMVGRMSKDKCQCIPIVLMQMAMGIQELMGQVGQMEGLGSMLQARALTPEARKAANSDVITDVQITVGKNTCTCSFEFFTKGSKVDLKKSRVGCDKKCSGAAKDVELEAPSGNIYSSIAFNVKTGRGKIIRASLEMARS